MLRHVYSKYMQSHVFLKTMGGSAKTISESPSYPYVIDSPTLSP